MHHYDVIVIGGGHAGVEAANAAARRGARTLLLTQNLETIGQMSCNPAIGGIAKGTVVREVDALGGIMARATDLAGIQFRMLNRSKGPAVWSPRAQCDRGLYRRAVRTLLERNARVHFLQGTVARLQLQGGRVQGVVTTHGDHISSGAVVLTAGTFLRGNIHMGVGASIPAGRAGEAPAVEIAQAIATEGFTIERFKTGTPPRIDGRSVDLAYFQRQEGDPLPYWFSFYQRSPRQLQMPCFLGYTGARVKEIIQKHLRESALYGGAISGRGPRYCPSVEDKIVKFPEAERHQVFLEPEGLETSEMYVNGLSTSLPPSVQLEFLRAVPGLAQVKMTRPGYAIEYDYFPPTQLNSTLETKALRGLFFAGQINGTTGYEEAAGQGIVAGINAAATALGLDSVVLGRDQAYIGLLVDDLVSRGVDEPYRLFTSRAEFRLLLRQDNALRRLFDTAKVLGLLTPEEEATGQERLTRESSVLALMRDQDITPEQSAPVLLAAGYRPMPTSARISDLVRRPGVSLEGLCRSSGLELGDWDSFLWAEIELKYEGYLERERASAGRLAKLDGFTIPGAAPFLEFESLSFESREKLNCVRPATIGQASRVPGVSPSDLQNLVLEILKWQRNQACFT